MDCPKGWLNWISLWFLERLWQVSRVCDVLRTASGNTACQTVATYCIAAGIVGGLVAAAPGLIDYFSIDQALRKRSASLHLALNWAQFFIFAINMWLRLRLPTESYLPPGNVDSRSSRHRRRGLARR